MIKDMSYHQRIVLDYSRHHKRVTLNPPISLR